MDEPAGVAQISVEVLPGFAAPPGSTEPAERVKLVLDLTASMRAAKWEKSKFQGREITGKTLGVVGLGNIGRIAASRAQGLKMKVIASDPVMTKDKAASLGVELVSFDELVQRADFVTLHIPLTPDTKDLFNAATFEKMKPGAMIVNAAMPILAAP